MSGQCGCAGDPARMLLLGGGGEEGRGASIKIRVDMPKFLFNNTGLITVGIINKYK